MATSGHDLQVSEQPAWAPQAANKPPNGAVLEARFRELASAWMRDVINCSSVTQMSMHPAYQQIIGMGPDAVPLILRELEREANHWFWALRSITGEDPVPPASRGRVREMAAAWLSWGRQRGLLS